jgi:hypothetical protein
MEHMRTIPHKNWILTLLLESKETNTTTTTGNINVLNKNKNSGTKRVNYEIS